MQILQLNDFRNLSAPPADALAKRDEAVRILINAMGHKYRLSRPMPKITKEK